MKGILFTAFNKMVEERFGLPLWDEMLETLRPSSQGIYTAGETYEDSEFLSLLSLLAEKIHCSVSDLSFEYGQYLLFELASKYEFFFNRLDLKEFLIGIDQVIHSEVKKIYPDSVLPEFSYKEIDENTFLMIYRSSRKLCRIAEGLMIGASHYFKNPIKIQHIECVHQGSQKCCFKIFMNQ